MIDETVLRHTPFGGCLVEKLRDRLCSQEREQLQRHNYEAFHSLRYEALFQLLDEFAERPSNRVLDIGRSPLSYRLAGRYREVVTLGFPLEQLRRDYPLLGKAEPTARPADHIVFDLNDFGRGRTIDPSHGRFDLVVFAETIEHLTAAPELVLAGLAEVLRPGGLLICQPPNTAALHRRLKLRAGYNPYERIRVDPTDPGHFREYTRDELIEIGHTVGLEVVRHVYKDYFGCGGSRLRRSAAAILGVASRIVPNFARGQTIVYRRPVA